MNKIFYFLFFIFFILSCQKEFPSIVEQPKNKIPTFSSVSIDEVFTEDQLNQNEIDSISNIVEDYYETVWDRENLWGSFLIAKGDQIIYENYRGYSKVNHTSPINATTPLHIASASKPLTAMAILKLVEAKKINLDSYVDHYLKEFPYPNITIRSLLSQRSGLPKYEHFTAHLPKNEKKLLKEYLTNQDLLDLLVKHKPPMALATDSGFMYNNLNYALLALIIENITKMSYPKAMKEMVFEPLEMKDSFVFQKKDLKNMSSTFYQKDEREHSLDRFDLIYGDKNIYTTPRDLLNFSIAMFSKDFLEEDIINQVFLPYSNEKPGVNNYGLGFRMKIFNSDQKLVYHTGWWHGTNSVFVHQNKTKVTIIAIGNKFSRRVYSARTLAKLFEPLPLEIPLSHSITIDSLSYR